MNPLYRLLPLLLSPLIALAAGFEPDREVVYKTVGDVELKLHVFEPADLKATDKRPAAVFFFGGGWSGGTPKQFFQQARVFADQGILSFSADYRVKSRNGTTPVESVKDAKSAVRWIRQHAAELGIDPDRIIASGGSAGGHIAACTGTVVGYEEAGEDLSISSVPNLMILFNPVADTTPETGFAPERFPAGREAELSPCHNVRAGIAPTLVFHGTADKTVPFEQVARFAKLMNEAGNDCVLIPFKDQGHGFFNGSFFRKRNTDDAFNATMEFSSQFLTEHGYR
ncbi:MAG: alpha/beta hydrolase [Opitutaceae bacterium]